MARIPERCWKRGPRREPRGSGANRVARFQEAFHDLTGLSGSANKLEILKPRSRNIEAPTALPAW